jgi:hypothetical protein
MYIQSAQLKGGLAGNLLSAARRLIEAVCGFEQNGSERCSAG